MQYGIVSMISRNKTESKLEHARQVLMNMDILNSGNIAPGTQHRVRFIMNKAAL